MATAVELLRRTASDERDIDYRLEHFVLDPANRFVPSVDIADLVVGGSPELVLTMQGASTLDLTVLDEDLALLGGDFLTGWTWGENADRDEAHWIKDGRMIDARLDDLPLRLVKLTGPGRQRQLGMQLEARAVNKLRQKRGALKVYRTSGFTRARFVKKLCDEAGVENFIPEIDIVQPQERPEETREGVEKDGSGRTHRKGISYKAKLKGKEGTLGRAQIANANIALDEADRLRAPRKSVIALIEACIVEGPDFKNPEGGEGTSSGILQLTAGKPDRRNVRSVVRRFLTVGFTGRGGAIDLARRNPKQSAGWIAQQVQGSAHPSRYDLYDDQAIAIYREYFGGSAEGETPTDEREVEKPYPFARGRKEDSWDCINRLAEEVGWYAFERKDVIWYVSGDWLRSREPAYVIDSDDAAVDSLDGEIDIGARDLVSEIEVQVYADRWTALQGTVVRVSAAYGPYEGRWTVQQISGPLRDKLKTVTLFKPLPPKPEPAPETTTETVKGNRREAAGALRERIVAKAKASMTSRSGFRRYSQAGRITDDPTPPIGARTDCSQWVRAVYLQAGAKDPGRNTWEQARKGKRVSKPKPGDLVFPPNTSHVELYIGKGKTIGHGSPPIDEWSVAGVRSRFGGAYFVTYDFLD